MNESIATAYAMLAATTHKINGARRQRKIVDSGTKDKQKRARRLKNKQASKARKQK